MSLERTVFLIKHRNSHEDMFPLKMRDALICGTTTFETAGTAIMGKLAALSMEFWMTVLMAAFVLLMGGRCCSLFGTVIHPNKAAKTLFGTALLSGTEDVILLPFVVMKATIMIAFRTGHLLAFGRKFETSAVAPLGAEFDGLMDVVLSRKKETTVDT